jgi:hypothetical protein
MILVDDGNEKSAIMGTMGYLDPEWVLIHLILLLSGAKNCLLNNLCDI